MAIQQAKTKDPYHFYKNTEGLNTASTRFGRNQNQAAETQNIIFTKSGGIIHRGGQAKVQATAASGSPELLYGIEFVRTVSGTTTRQKIAWGANGKVYDFATNPPTEILTGLTANKVPDVIVTHGWLAFVNGADTPKKYDGTTWYNWGITAPASAPTLALGGAGSPNGTYRFRVAYRRNALSAIDPGHVSSMGTISGTITAANQIINLTNIPLSADPQVNARDVLVEIGGDWYIATTLNDNTTTVYAYNMLDSTAVLGEKGRIDRNTPAATLETIELHDNVAFGSDGRLLYWSILDEFESFSSLDRASNAFEPGDGTKIVSLNSYDDLMVGKERSIFVRSGDDVSYTVTKKIYDSGVISKHSVVVKDNIAYYLAHDGFRRFNGNESFLLSRNIHNLLFGSSTEKIIYSDKLSRITGVYYSSDKTNTIIWSLPTSSTDYTKALVYSFDFQTTDPLAQPVGSWATWAQLDASYIFKAINSTTLNDVLYTCGKSGFMRQVDTGYTDDGNPIACVYRQADQFFERPTRHKRLRDIAFVFSISEAPTVTPSIEWYVNGGPSGVVRTMNLLSSGAIFDSSLFDASLFPQEGDFVAVTGYTHDPFLTIAPRITWNVSQSSDGILINGWSMRALDAGFRRPR